MPQSSLEPGRILIPVQRAPVSLTYVAIAGIVLLALVLRLFFVFSINTESVQGDARNYDVMAHRWIEQGIYSYVSADESGAVAPNAYITPGYPIFLALIYQASGYAGGDAVVAVRLAQALVSSLTVLLLILIGRKMADWRTGCLAGILLAIYPSAVWSVGVLLTEAIFLAFFLLALYLILVALDKAGQLIWWLPVGIVVGAGLLIRPVALILIPVIGLMTIRPFSLGTIKIWALITAGLVAAMLPWWLRNYFSLHQWIWTATQSANPFYAGMLPYFQNDSSLVPPEVRSGDAMKDNLIMLQHAFVQKPRLFLQWFTIGKTFFLYSFPWNDSPPRTGGLAELLKIHQPVLALGIAGMATLWRNRAAQVIILTIIFYTLFQLMFVPMFRYGFPVYPLFALLASQLLFALVDMVRGIVQMDNAGVSPAA